MILHFIMPKNQHQCANVVSGCYKKGQAWRLRRSCDASLLKSIPIPIYHYCRHMPIRITVHFTEKLQTVYTLIDKFQDKFYYKYLTRLERQEASIKPLQSKLAVFICLKVPGLSHSLKQESGLLCAELISDSKVKMILESFYKVFYKFCIKYMKSHNCIINKSCLDQCRPLLFGTNMFGKKG